MNVFVRDLSQPDQLYVPEYGGQIYIIVALACGCFVVAGSVVLALLWAVIIWNVRVANGDNIPWWACATGRGW